MEIFLTVCFFTVLVFGVYIWQRAGQAARALHPDLSDIGMESVGYIRLALHTVRRDGDFSELGMAMLCAGLPPEVRGPAICEEVLRRELEPVLFTSRVG